MKFYAPAVGILLAMLAGCHAGQPNHSYLYNARPADAAGTQVFKIPYDPSQPGYEFIPVLATSNYADATTPQYGYRILCRDKGELETFLRSIGAWESYQNQEPAYAVPGFPSEAIKKLNIQAQPPLLCAKDRVALPADAGSVKQDTSRPAPNYFLRFQDSPIENVPWTYYQLGCEGLLSGLGYDAKTAVGINIDLLKGENSSTREITINCPAGKAFNVDEFLTECETALKLNAEGLGSAYRDLMVARGVVDNSCSTLYSTVKDLTTLDLSGQGLRDLRPLRHLRKLETLNVRDNSVEDITPLTVLSQLRKLNLGMNYYLGDISTLSQLTRLTELQIDNTSIESLESLSGLRDLTTLDIKGDSLPVASLEKLRGLLKLQTLSYDTDYLFWDESQQTFFSSCAYWNDLPNDHKPTLKNILAALMVTPDASGNMTLAKCRLALSRAQSKTTFDLKSFKTTGDDKSCLMPKALWILKEFKNMALQLDYSNCGLGVADLSVLGQLPKLSSVDISYNNLSDLRPLSAWRDISSVALNLEGNSAEGDYCPVSTGNLGLSAFCKRNSNPFIAECQEGSASANWPVYQELFKRQSLIEGRCLQLYDQMKSVTSLDLSNLVLPSFAPLAYLTNLQVLKIANTKTTDLRSLSVLTSIVELDVSGNTDLSSLNGLEKLVNLKKLTMSETAVANLEPLKDLLNFDTLVAQNNVNLSYQAFDVLKATKLTKPILTGTPLRWSPSQQTFYTNCLFMDALSVDQRQTMAQMIRALGFSVNEKFEISARCDLVYRTMAQQSVYDLRSFKILPSDQPNASQKCLDIVLLHTLIPFTNLSELKLDLSECSVDESTIGSVLALAPLVQSVDLRKNNIKNMNSWTSLFESPATVAMTLQLDGNPVPPEDCPVTFNNQSLKQFCVNRMPFTIACKTNDLSNDIGPTMDALYKAAGPSVQGCEERFLALYAKDKLILDRAKIKNLEPLRGLMQLKTLVLYINEITSIEALKGLRSLTYLALDRNKISSLEPLRGMTQLDNLSLEGCGLTSIEPLQNLTKLTYLNIASNRLTSIVPTWGMRQMTFFNMGSNLVTNLDQVQDMSELKTLMINANQITTLAPLRKLTKLNYLSVDVNPVWKGNDYCPMDALSSAVNTYCTKYNSR